MKINSISVNGNFKYLWLKSVTDVDLSQHCAKSLIGEYDERIFNELVEATDIILEDKVYYLCGVSFPFNYYNNFHLAFRPKVGETITVYENGISIIIQDAEKLPISSEHIDYSLPKARFKSYNTCRNWQFANYFKRHIK